MDDLYPRVSELARRLFTTGRAAVVWSIVDLWLAYFGDPDEGLQHAGASCLLIAPCVAVAAARRVRDGEQFQRAVAVLVVTVLPFVFLIWALSQG